MQPAVRTNDDLPRLPVQQDAIYYFLDIVFLVEDTLFKIPRHYFEQGSIVFRDMFSLPSGADTSTEGSTKENPLRLDGVSKSDFRQLLRIICPRHVLPRDELSCSEWVSVLKLSTMWEFEDARRLAIDALTPMGVDAITRIELARAYRVHQWFWPALRTLGEQDACLRTEDVHRLGLDLSLRVAELRGRVGGFRRAALSKACGGQVHGACILALEFIGELFSEEVKDVPLAECDEAIKLSCRYGRI